MILLLMPLASKRSCVHPNSKSCFVAHSSNLSLCQKSGIILDTFLPSCLSSVYVYLNTHLHSLSLFSHTDTHPPYILSIQFILLLNISYIFLLSALGHCHHLSQAIVISSLDYSNSLLIGLQESTFTL